MKIVFVIDLLTGYHSRGGAEIQFHRTKESLQELGINVAIYDSNPETLLEADLIHFFKLDIFHYKIARFCVDNKIPYVISSIYFNLSFRMKILSIIPIFLANKYYSFLYTKFLCDNAEFIFPNTNDEKLQIQKHFRQNSKKVKVIHNGVDDPRYDYKLEDIPDLVKVNMKELQNKYIFNLGRIEKRKNQVRLAKAAAKLNMKVVIAGPANLKSKYVKKVLSFNNVIYVGEVWDKTVKSYLFDNCLIYSLPSTLETPGISAMEATFFNCPIVITKYGGTKEYFGENNNVKYIDPFSVSSILSGLKSALSILNNGHTLDNSKIKNWSSISKEYLPIYKRILNDLGDKNEK